MIPARFDRILKSPALPFFRWIDERDRRHFQAEGYMVIRNVIPTSMTRNAVREIAAFVGADLSDSATWYRSAPQLDGVVPMHHAQSLWDIRQNPSLYHVFTEFFRNPRLMVDINRCIFRPPVHRDFRTEVTAPFIGTPTPGCLGPVPCRQLYC